VGKKTARPSASRISCRQAGFSLVEVAILSILLLVAVGGLAGAVLSSVKLSRSSEESALADEAARALAARLYTVPFETLFRSYNNNPQDDLGVPGSAPGAAFDVRGLTPRTEDADGRVGRIVFPVVDMGGGVEALREDVIDERMGMSAEFGGLDLNGDGDVLDDVSVGYVLLPARLIVEWTGAGGNRSYELDLLLAP
jgi:type II secretory pathway pseudopilin PulG